MPGVKAVSGGVNRGEKCRERGKFFREQSAPENPPETTVDRGVKNWSVEKERERERISALMINLVRSGTRILGGPWL